MSKHTPGPWKITAGYDRSTISGGMGESGHPHVVAEVRHPTAFRIDEGPANARLIAASPEMLEALKDAKTTIDAMLSAIDDANDAWPSDNQKKWHEFCATFDKVAAAIEKAEGA